MNSSFDATLRGGPWKGHVLSSFRELEGVAEFAEAHGAEVSVAGLRVLLLGASGGRFARRRVTAALLV